jgi:hypothetical protein
LVQEQRKVLGANVNEMKIFKRFAKDIEVIIASVGVESINFKVEFKKLEMVQEECYRGYGTIQNSHEVFARRRRDSTQGYNFH